MNMTTSYLLAKCEEVKEIELNKPYRVIGLTHPGAIYTPIKIEDNIVYFKGYVRGKERTKLKFFEIVDNFQK